MLLQTGSRKTCSSPLQQLGKFILSIGDWCSKISLYGHSTSDTPIESPESGHNYIGGLLYIRGEADLRGAVYREVVLHIRG